MSAVAAARRIADHFDEAGVDYAIGGALALGVWGAPRSTVDVDISAFVGAPDVGKVFDALERAGVLFDRSQATADVERIGLLRGRLGRTPIDVFISEHPHSKAMAERRRAIADPDGVPRWFLSPEDLIVLKLFYGRSKDILDLERLTLVRPDIDLEYVRSWISKMVPPGDRRLDELDELERG